MRATIRYFASILAEAVRAITSAQKLRQTLRSPLHANSLYLMLNSGVNAGFGLIFWLVAARLYSTEDVGLGSALISAAILLSFIASLGLGYGLIRFLPSAGERRQAIINSSLMLVALASLVVSIIFLAGLPLWSPAFLPVRSNPVFLAAFIGFVVVWTVYSLIDNVFLSFRRAEFILAKGVIFNLGRVAAVAALALVFRMFGIFTACAIAALVTLVVSLGFLRRLLPGYRPRGALQRQVSNEMFHFSFTNYVSSGLLNAPQWVLPIMVVNLLGATANAYFYIAWGVVNLLFAIPGATSMSLFAEGSHQTEHLRRDLLRSLKLTAVLLIPAMLIILAIGDKILLLFGSEYSMGGAHLFWFLVPSALPMSVNVLYLGVARVLKRLKDIALVAGCIAVGTLTLSYFLLPHLGISGAAVAWLTAQSLVALAVLPKLRKVIVKKETVTVSDD